MARSKAYMEIRILHSFIVEQNPGIIPHDPKVAAEAYGKQFLGDRLISTGTADFEEGPHGKVVFTSYEYWDGEDDVVPAGAAQTFPTAEGA